MCADTTREQLRNTLARIVGNAIVGMAYGCDIHLAAERDGAGTCWIKAPGGGELSPEVLRVVGVAGPVAEALINRGGPEQTSAHEMLDLVQSVDAELPEHAHGYTLFDVSRALSILAESYPLLADEVAAREHQIMWNASLIN